MICKIILYIAIAIFLYWLFYYAFNVCLLDDVEFSYGKGARRHRKKREGSFWRRFFFIDIYKKTVKWHYLFFWIYNITFILTLVVYIVYIITNIPLFHKMSYIIGSVCFVICVRISLVRFFLYWPNIKRRDFKKWRR